MANEITQPYPTGANLYAVLLSGQGLAWNGSGTETPTAAHRPNYAVALAESSALSAYYQASAPAGLPAGRWGVVVHLRAGASPAASDVIVGDGDLDWDGTQEVTLGSRQAAGSAVTLPSPAPAGYGPGTGSGAVVVDHDYPTTDALRYVDGYGAGIAAASIRAYLAADYLAGNTGASFVAGEATTGTDGRWLAPIALTPGSYTLLAYKAGSFDPSVVPLTVT